jgi:hypothetical protein
MTGLIGKFNDGGPIFTYTILIILLVIIVLFAIEIIKTRDRNKVILIIKNLGWLAVAWGFMGRTFGLIKAFDMVAAQGELTPRLLADGLKMALIDPLFGIFVFVVARALVIFLITQQKKQVY